MTTRRRGRSTAPDETESSADEYDHEPPCAAAAFVASASAAVLVLLAVLLAVVLSAAALWTVASMMPVADAAADVSAVRLRGSDYLHRWHRPQRPQQPYLEHHMRQIRRRGVDEDALRRKRQLLFKKSREPGVIALTFNLIGGVSVYCMYPVPRAVTGKTKTETFRFTFLRMIRNWKLTNI